ncbi:MAG: TrmH family RNA methyltransferase [bacterium]
MISKTRLRTLSSLTQKKYREKFGLFLAEGINLCEEVLKSDFQIKELIYCPEILRSTHGESLLERFKNEEVPVEQLPEAAFLKISNTVHSQGVISVVATKRFSLNALLKQKPRIVVALERITDPGNLGTIIRTADWFGTGGVVIGENSVEVTNPKVVRATMGSIFHLPILTNQKLGRTLLEFKRHGYSLVAADVDGSVSYSQLTFKGNQVLLLGNEITGISEELKGDAVVRVKIPKTGMVDSLNVAVAAGIFLAEMSRS